VKCVVCLAGWPAGRGTVCPQCGWDLASPLSRDTDAVLAARSAFRATSTAYAPDSRVTRRDRLVPWLGLGLGAVLFLFVLASCTVLFR
jgi:hypothetical protein